jgi:hypothetical protein
MMALVALVYLAALEFTPGGVAAHRTDKTLRPAQLIQGSLALGFATVLVKKIVQSAPFLKLDHIFRHDGKPPVFSGFHYASCTGSIAEPCG